MPAVAFFSEHIRFRFPHSAKARSWVKKVIASEGFDLIQLNYIFTSDEYLLQINQQYLSHSNLTDIITFDNSDQEGVVEGDIFISIPRVKENASTFDQTFERELFRVIIHGVLHLCGYKDKSATQKRLMRKKEDHYLSLLKF